ncbi:MAG: CsbD family protein [Alphaproteobacteria bacterium]
MHKDQIKGAAKDAVGSMKKTVGRATGDSRMEAEGMAEQAEGKVQRAVGDAKETIRDVLKR